MKHEPLRASHSGAQTGQSECKVGARSRAGAAQLLIEWEIAAQVDAARLQIGDQEAIVLSRQIETNE
jgi:hypothetical protein